MTESYNSYEAVYIDRVEVCGRRKRARMYLEGQEEQTATCEDGIRDPVVRLRKHGRVESKYCYISLRLSGTLKDS